MPLVYSLGVELRRQFHALYVPSSTGVNDRPFSIFIRALGVATTPSRSAIYLSKVADEICTGTVVGRPREVTRLAGSLDGEKNVFVAE